MWATVVCRYSRRNEFAMNSDCIVVGSPGNNDGRPRGLCISSWAYLSDVSDQVMCFTLMIGDIVLGTHSRAFLASALLFQVIYMYVKLFGRGIYYSVCFIVGLLLIRIFVFD